MAASNSLNISQPGYVVFDGVATFTGRTFQAGAGISLANASGVAGNTTISASASVPTSFVTNSGTAVPVSSILNVLGGTGITTSGSGNTLTIALTGGGAIETITGNTGGAESPLAGNFNILGTGSITIAGSANTETVQLTGLTNHAIQIGAGTATLTQLGAGTTGQVLQTNTGADPTWSTATYPSTTPINQILYSSAANTVTGLATANNGVLTTGTTGIPVITALASNGQIIIGSGSGAPAAATLTPGAGITITNAANSITIAATNPSGFPWTDVTNATQTLAVNNGYLTDRSAGVVYTLPSTAAIGDTILIVGKLGITTITPNANQQILMSSASDTVGATGTAVGTNVGDCITLICITAGASTVWRSNNFVGNWTLN